MKPKIIDVQPMQRMSECRFIFGHCGRSFISPTMYKSASTKKSRFLGPCSKPQAIFAMRLLALSICRGFLCECIGTYLV